ncbi:MAG TPA: hypothetical protein VFM70_09805 [Salinimicrobium sp.]|nr:hypothetical protein [Salinimicrobium sp.]
MKIKLTSLLLMLLVISACSSEDDGPGDTSSDSNYFPLSMDNYWNYDNRSQEVGMEEMQSEDSLYVAEESNNSYTLDAEQPVEGLTTSLFANGNMKKNGSQLLYTGSFDFMIEGFESFSIPLQNVVVYDASANAGSELYSVSNTLTETVNSIPFEIEYTVSTTDEGDLASFDVNGVTYEDVISSKFILTLRITTSIEVFGDPIEIPILETQDISVGQNFYAADVGMIQSDVVFSYELEDLSQYPISLPVAQSATVNSSQELTTYVAVED